MGLSFSWSWAVPKIEVANAEQNAMAQGIGSLGESLGRMNQARYQKEQNRLARERQQLLDAQAEEDRQRRIAEEDARKGVYSQMSRRLLGDGSSDLESLKQQQQQLMQSIASLKNKWGM